MTQIKGYVVGAYELPMRRAEAYSTAQLHGMAAAGALEDAGLSFDDVDGYFCAGDAPGLGGVSMVDYLNLNVRHVDNTELGGCSYIAHVNHAVQAIEEGRCSVALITMAGRPLSEARGLPPILGPEDPWEAPYRPMTAGIYAMSCKRHMYEYGTTSEQLAWVKVAASHHAQHNPHALLRDVVTVEDVLASPLIWDPLHRMDCCVITDGGGALVVARPEIAKSLSQPRVAVRAGAEAIKGQNGGKVDLLSSAGAITGKMAFESAGITPADIDYASIYDSFTFTVLLQLEDLGFCERGKGGAFVSDGNLISGVGKLPVNTDGGGLSNNHPASRGGITKVIEAVRQLRGTAHPAVQVKDCRLALAHGTGFYLGTRHGSATLIMERE